MALSEPNTRKPLHRRQITIDAYERADGLTELEATLVDTKPFAFRIGSERPNVPPGEAIHHICLRMAVDGSAIVQECEVSMQATPYRYCGEVRSRFDLTGIKLGGGFMKAVRDRIGVADNCWHVRQILPQLATVLVQARYPAERARSKSMPAGDRIAPAMLGTCAGWQANRPHVLDEYPEYYAAAGQAGAPDDGQ